MIPTAISQLIEQAVKFSLGLISVIFLRLDTTLSVAVCLGAVTLSEIFALAFLGVKYVLDVKKLKPSLPKRELSPHLTVSYGDIVRTVFPITFTFLMLPLSRVADSFLVVNIVSRYTENATSLYGLYSGAVESVVGVPVAICYGISVVATPFIAKNKKDFVGKAKLIGATVSFAFLCAVATFLFAKTAVNVLYGGLSEADRETVVALLKISALSVLFLPVLQTTNAILIGEGKPFVASVSMLLGVGAKLAVILLTVVNPQINVAGVAFSDICCYFVATNFNLLYIINDRYFSANKTALRRAKNAVI